MSPEALKRAIVTGTVEGATAGGLKWVGNKFEARRATKAEANAKPKSNLTPMTDADLEATQGGAKDPSWKPSETGVTKNSSNIPNNKAHTPDQRATIELAKEAKKNGGLSFDEADTLLDWADEYNVPSHGPEIHENRPGEASHVWHIHVGKTGHIPIKDGGK